MFDKLAVMRDNNWCVSRQPVGLPRFFVGVPPFLFPLPLSGFPFPLCKLFALLPSPPQNLEERERQAFSYSLTVGVIVSCPGVQTPLPTPVRKARPAVKKKVVTVMTEADRARRRELQARRLAMKAALQAAPASESVLIFASPASGVRPSAHMSLATDGSCRPMATDDGPLPTGN